MPSTKLAGRGLNATLSGDNVTLHVNYDVDFTEYDKGEARDGQWWKDRVEVWGADSDQRPRKELFSFPHTPTFNAPVERRLDFAVKRSDLQADAIKCRIVLYTVYGEDTDEELGSIWTPIQRFEG